MKNYWVLELPGEEDTIVCNHETRLVRVWLSQEEAIRARDSYPGDWMGSDPITSYRPFLKWEKEIKALGFRCRGILITSGSWTELGRELWR